MFNDKINLSPMMSMAMRMRGSPRTDNLPMLAAA